MAQYQRFLSYLFEYEGDQKKENCGFAKIEIRGDVQRIFLSVKNNSYVFEVGSAGLERQLKRPGDFAQFMGSPVLVKTYQPKDGRKEFAGTLAGYDNGAVLLDMGGETVRFEKNETALVRLRVEF